MVEGSSDAASNRSTDTCRETPSGSDGLILEHQACTDACSWKVMTEKS